MPNISVALHRHSWLRFASCLLSLFLCMLLAPACGPAESESTTTPAPITTPATKPSRQRLSFTEILNSLEKLESSLATASAHDVTVTIGEMSAHITESLPLELAQPFHLHTFHDRLSKTATAIGAKNDAAIKQSFFTMLDALSRGAFTGQGLRFPIDVSVAREVVNKKQPSLTTVVRDDFTGFSKQELDERQAISVESFWSGAFLYSSNSGVTKEQDTGAILATHDGTMVAILEFKNERAVVRPLDFTRAHDLASTVSMMPGYVSSVGRKAAFARLGIGEKLFQAFFTHARARGITNSYLHVRHDSEAALNLYKKLGYTVVGTVADYYNSPTANALVMHKRL